jgi:DNA repair photolyase
MDIQYAMASGIPASGFKGRGALSNPSNRFASAHSEGVDDGWHQDELPESIATEIRIDASRSIIARNESPDIPYDQSINPYRGCEHGCVFCLSGETPILMADGRTRPLESIRAGDEIIGTARRGWYRQYTRTRVLAQWSVIKPAWRITLEDGTVLVAGGDHRFLTERGWKFVTGKEQGAGRRSHLTTGNKLMGVGALPQSPPHDADYRQGYLTGLIRGDGMIGEFSYPMRSGKGGKNQAQFRLALCDAEALDRAQLWLAGFEVETRRFVHLLGNEIHRRQEAIRTCARSKVNLIREITAWPDAASNSWRKGFLAGIFDAEGSYSGGVLRISNTDGELFRWITESLAALGFETVVERPARFSVKPIEVVRLLGGLSEHLRFFLTTDPAISRKRAIDGQRVKSRAKLGVTSIEPLPGALRLYDISTGTEDFIANGVVSHNCYARPTHAYLDLSPGVDFETKLLYKPEAAALLRQELARPGYKCRHIMLGSNTDPYQPIERQLGVTRSILEVLAETRHPVAITTRSTLVLRDLDLLGSMAAQGLASVYISITTFDAVLKRKLEPRSAASLARLHVMRELAAAGVPVGVMAAPIIPAINDSELEEIIDRAAAAGATRAGYTLLRLPHEVKDLFREWLAQHMPDRAAHVMSLIQEMRGGRDNDPQFGSRMRGKGAWAELLRARFHLACRRHGLNAGRDQQLDTGLFRPASLRPQLDLGF